MNFIRLTLLVAAALASAASGGDRTARTAPPPLGGQPQPWNSTPGAPVASVEGQGFTGQDGTDRINFYFRKGGVLHYRDPQGWWEDGRWQQKGALVTFTLSDGFATYNGQIIGSAISGDAVNKNRKTWKFSVQAGTPRQPARVELANTSWGGREDKNCIVLMFLPDGRLEYATPSGRFTDGTWEIDGDWVYLKHKSTGFEYFGNVKGERMNGNLWASNGQRWSWDVNRDAVPEECQKNATGMVTKGVPGSKEPPKTSAPAAAVATIEGSTWEGDNGGDATTFQFKPGGVLLAKDPQGDWKGSWFQNGLQVTFDLNGRYSWYEGLLDAAGTTMSGAGHNKDGLDWKFLVKKK